MKHTFFIAGIATVLLGAGLVSADGMPQASFARQGIVRDTVERVPLTRYKKPSFATNTAYRRPEVRRRVWVTRKEDLNATHTVVGTAYSLRLPNDAFEVSPGVYQAADDVQIRLLKQDAFCADMAFELCVRSAEKQANALYKVTAELHRTHFVQGYTASIYGAMGEQTRSAQTTHVVALKSQPDHVVQRGWFVGKDGTIYGIETRGPIEQSIHQSGTTKLMLESFRVF